MINLFFKVVLYSMNVFFAFTMLVFTMYYFFSRSSLVHISIIWVGVQSLLQYNPLINNYILPLFGKTAFSCINSVRYIGKSPLENLCITSTFILNLFYCGSNLCFLGVGFLYHWCFSSFYYLSQNRVEVKNLSQETTSQS